MGPPPDYDGQEGGVAGEGGIAGEDQSAGVLDGEGRTLVVFTRHHASILL
jgi:hypothetical protein